MANDPQNPNQPSRSGDFSGQLNDMLAPNSQYQHMLAPYQQMAQQFQSPYATMNQNSWLAQNHPQLAGHLDNAFLTMGMTPQAQGPEGVGGGITRMMQGLMGGQQFQRQRMMQQAMMPYQMLGQSLQPMDMMAQIQARQSQAMREQDYHEMVTNRFGQGGIEQQKLEISQQRADQAKYGRQLSDPVERMAFLRHPPKDPANPTPEEMDKIANYYQQVKEGSRPQAGLTQNQLAAAATPRKPGESEASWAGRVGQQVSDWTVGTAGRRAGAEQSATQPGKQTQAFVAAETSRAYDSLAKPESEEAWLAKQPFGMLAGLPSASGDKARDSFHKQYTQIVEDYKKKKTELDTNMAKWKRSGAPEQGLGLDEWIAQPQSQQAVPSTSAPAGKQTSGPSLGWNPN